LSKKSKKKSKKEKKDKLKISVKKTEKKLDNMVGLSSTEQDLRGFVAEDKVLMAAKFWKKNGILGRVRKIKRFSPEDLSGVDFVLTLLTGEEIMVQVKNHYHFDAAKKCWQDGIIFFVAWASDTEQEIKEKILSLILLEYVKGLPPYRARSLIKKVLEAKSKSQKN
jgi:hypothetical protein